MIKFFDSASRPTIGMLINTIEGRYQTRLWRGMYDLAIERNFNLVFFTGKNYNSTDQSEIQYNTIYKLFSATRIDGLIITSDSLTNDEDIAAIFQFEKEAVSIPKISLSFQLSGVPCVLLDNKSGMRDLVNHLIDAHDCRKMAFVKGPDESQEAKDRFMAFEEVLTARGIPIDPALILEGNFQDSGGSAAVIHLFDDLKAKPEAILFSNDEMALSAIKTLTDRGIRVPEDVIITGFDDLIDTRFTVPPITTVRQPIYEKVKLAGEILLDIMDGKKVPEKTVLPTELVVRESCGCLAAMMKDLERDMAPPTTRIQHLEAWVVEGGRSLIVQEMLEALAIPVEEKPIWKEELIILIDLLIRDIREKNSPSSMLTRLNYLLNRFVAEVRMIALWADGLFIIRRRLFPYINDPVELDYANVLFGRAQGLIGMVMENSRAKKVLGLENYLWELRYILEKLNSAVSLAELSEIMLENLPKVGIRSCYLTLYHEEESDYQRQYIPLEEKKPTQNWIPPANSMLVSAFDERGQLVHPGSARKFLTQQLLPAYILPDYKRITLLAMPLFKNDNQFGYILFEMLKMDVGGASLYAALREQISNALQTSLLFLTRKEAQERLTATMKELKKSEEKFRDMAYLLPSIIIETDMDMRMVFLNKSGLELFGMSDDDLLRKKSILEFVPADEQGRLKEYGKSVINGQNPVYSEFRVVTAAGTKVTFLSKAIPISRDGRVDGIRWSIMDIKPFMNSILQPGEAYFSKFHLSQREKEILTLLLQGFKNKDIGSRLFITERTVKGHITALYRKIGVNNKSELFESMKENQVKQFGQESFLISVLSKIMND